MHVYSKGIKFEALVHYCILTNDFEVFGNVDSQTLHFCESIIFVNQMHIVNCKFESKKLQNEQDQSVYPRLGKV